MQGASDVLMIPNSLDLSRIAVVAGTGWLLCDVHFADGRPVPFATRNLYKGVLADLTGAVTISSRASKSSATSSSSKKRGWRRKTPPARPPA